MEQKAVEDGLHWKTTTQRQQQKNLRKMRESEETLKASQQDTLTEWDWVTMN